MRPFMWCPTSRLTKFSSSVPCVAPPLSSQIPLLAKTSFWLYPVCAKVGPRRVGDPKFRAFFSLSRHIFLSSSLGGPFVEFWWCFGSLEMCTFGVVGLSCEAPMGCHCLVGLSWPLTQLLFQPCVGTAPQGVMALPSGPHTDERKGRAELAGAGAPGETVAQNVVPWTGRGGLIAKDKLSLRFEDFVHGRWSHLIDDGLVGLVQNKVRKLRPEKNDGERHAARAEALVQMGELLAGRQALEGETLATQNCSPQTPDAGR